jgi:serine/threonine protein kinase
MMDTVVCDQCKQTYVPSKRLRGLCPTCLLAGSLRGIEAGGSSTPAIESADAARFVPPAVRDIAAHFPQLEIEGLAGHGGMSCVYQVRQTHLNRSAALKLLPREVAESAGGLERFQREAKTLAQLRHPQIVEVYDAGQAGPWCFILMEFVSGPNLRQLLGVSNLPPNDVKRIMSEICLGLQYAHDQGIVHRDMKPENVLLDKEGHVKLVDFGLAKLLIAFPLQSVRSQTGQVMGTLHYMAPEQARTPSLVDHRADVYAVGVMLYEMLTGELPLGHFEPPSKRSGCNSFFDSVVLRAMSQDPSKRYKSVRDLKAAMTAGNVTTSNDNNHTVMPGWSFSRLANELFLSTCSMMLMALGLLNLVKAMHYISDGLVHFWIFAVGLTFLLFSFLLARVNVSSKNSWSELSFAQKLCVPNLLLAYTSLAAILLLGPGLAALLLGAAPHWMNLESTKVLGAVFGQRDREWFLTPYWLNVYGLSMIASSVWCILLAFVVHVRPVITKHIFHPSDEQTVSVVTRISGLLSAALLLPIGIVLIVISWMTNIF